EHIGAAFDLLTGDRQRGGVIVGLDQLPEFRRAGDVCALADDDEIGEWVGGFAHAAAVNGSRPARRRRASGEAIARGVAPATAWSMWVMCSGVVPQHPPTILT